MAKLVEELQYECLNNSIPCSQLLLKAYAIARKLNNVEMTDFCKNEIDGYPDNSEHIPSFRTIEISLWAYNGVNWHSVAVPCNSFFTRHRVTQSVKELETLCFQGMNHFSIKLTTEQIDILRKACRNPRISDGQERIAAYKFEGIISKVRKIILDWVLTLNKNGVLEENTGLAFDEKHKTSSTTVININGPINGSNFVGSATNSTLNVNNTNSFDYEGVGKLLESVQKLLPAGNFAKDDLEKIQQDIDEIRESISKQNVPAVKGKLKDLAVFCKGIAGNVIASGVWAQIQPFLC